MRSPSHSFQLLEKRIDKFTETTSEQLLITNPESQTYVREELQKLNEKWRHFKDQVKNKRKSLDQATEFFEKVEKVSSPKIKSYKFKIEKKLFMCLFIILTDRRRIP